MNLPDNQIWVVLDFEPHDAFGRPVRAFWSEEAAKAWVNENPTRGALDVFRISMENPVHQVASFKVGVLV